MFDLKYLTVFREVAARGSFSAAAQALAYTPSAVSQQMSALERQTRTHLFVRTPRGMRLSHAGERLLPHATAMLDQLQEATSELAAMADGGRTRLRFGSFPSATTAFVGGALHRLTRAHPELELRFSDGEPFEILGQLRERRLDAALTWEFDRGASAPEPVGRPISLDLSLQCVHFSDDPLMLILPRGHRLAAREEVELGELAGEAILGTSRPSAPWSLDLQSACRAAGFEPCFEPRCRSSDFQALQAIVAVGNGVALIPRLALAGVRLDVAVRPLLGAPVRRVRLVIPAGEATEWARDLVLPFLSGDAVEA